MKHRSAWLWLVAFSMLIGIIGQPAGTEAQCAVTFTNLSTFPSTIVVTKQLSAPATCNLGPQNALNCFSGPVGPGPKAYFVASALTATMSPSCNWTCTCGSGLITVTIDGNDGLPIELMDFSVE